MRRKRGAAGAAPGPLTSLTGEQEDWLRRAAGTPDGVYIPVSHGGAAHQLVAGGAAEYREVQQVGGTRSVSDPTPCRWTDVYLVPTDYGLQLLGKTPRGWTARTAEAS